MTANATAAPYSLRARLLVVASAVLAAFLGLTGLTLDRAFADSARAAVAERLRGAVYTLLGAAEVGPGARLLWPAMLPDPRLSTPESGFYARVLDDAGRVVWRSPSMLGLAVPFPPPGEVGSARFATLVGTGGRNFFALTYTVAWEHAPGRVAHYAIQVAESDASFELQVAEYRQALWGWLAAVAAGLLLLQGAVLRWALAPLARVAAEVQAIESGRQRALEGRYPRELAPLTRNLNELIETGRAQLERHRHALADLAHSLKTPLAVMRTTLDDAGTEGAALREQVARIDAAVDYQLQRAAASGRTALAAPVPVRALLARVIASLAKVYRAKAIEFDMQADAQLQFAGDEGDLMEICGNLLDNACKWCRKRVRVQARAGTTGAGGLHLAVEDDGPGIPAAATRAVRERGVRVDAGTEGHGIGLAVVQELVEEVYRGRLEIGVGVLGGARVSVELPGR